MLTGAHREVFAGTGVMYEGERLDVEPGGLDECEADTARWTNYLTVKVERPDGNLFFSNTLYVQPRIDQPDDLRILNEADLAFKISENVSFSLTLVLLHGSEPPFGVEETDVQLSNGLRYRFWITHRTNPPALP